ncbi:MAG: hypothetical protein ABH863_01075 [Candidatus Micrarchaeota archaeon]
MEMDRSKLIKYGTLALIIIFGIEIIAFLFTQNPYQNTIPTPIPSATPVPERFEGINSTEGFVISIGRELLVICNTTQNPEGAIRQVPGVQAVSFDSQNLRLGIVAKENASLDLVVAGTRGELQSYCTPRIFKRAFVKLGNYLNFTSASGGDSKVLAGANFQCLQQHSLSQCFAFVQPETQANSTVPLLVYVRMVGSVPEFITAEEPRRQSPLEFKSAQAEALVTEILPGAAVHASIPWKDRFEYSEGQISGSLNGSLNYSEFSYEPVSEITILEELDNATLGKLGNLSFVQSVFPSDGGVIVQVKGGFNDEELLIGGFDDLNISSSEYEIPISFLSFIFDYSPEAEIAVSKALPKGTPVLRGVVAEITSIESAEGQLGGKLPEPQITLFARNATINSTILVSLNAIVQDGEISYLAGQELNVGN